jgi:hypothetical protein
MNIQAKHATELISFEIQCFDNTFVDKLFKSVLSMVCVYMQFIHTFFFSLQYIPSCRRPLQPLQILINEYVNIVKYAAPKWQNYQTRTIVRIHIQTMYTTCLLWSLNVDSFFLQKKGKSHMHACLGCMYSIYSKMQTTSSAITNTDKWIR